MLKKAGIIVAVAAAGLVAVSSFAFADETVTKDNLTTNCEFAAGGTATSSAVGGVSLLGAVDAVTSAATNAVAQAPALSCNNLNVEDVIDFDSNNPTETTTTTKVKDSFNTETDD